MSVALTALFRWRLFAGGMVQAQVAYTRCERGGWARSEHVGREARLRCRQTRLHAASGPNLWDAYDPQAGIEREGNYLRIPRLGLFSCCCRFLPFLRFGLLIINVPEPMYWEE